MIDRFRYINKNMQHEEYTIDFGHPNIIEMSVPFETESVKEKSNSKAAVFL